MYREQKIGIAVPAHNEEKLIAHVLETMPEFVDLIVVVDDCSSDRTAEIVKNYQGHNSEKVYLIQHEKNTGVGGAVCDAYEYAYRQGMDIVAVMAGDAQMDPAELPSLLDPVVDNFADYVKGNRLLDETVWKRMPKIRIFGNHFLSLMTKVSSGFWHIADSQGGYTALSKRALRVMNLKKVAKGYEFENSMLIHLNILGLRVINVPVSPVYGIGEKSGIVIWKEALRMSWYLGKSFFYRLWLKYFIRDFHPLLLFYMTGLLLSIPGLLLGTYLVLYRLLAAGSVATTTALFAVFLSVSGWQSLLFAMWLDMEAGKP